MFSPIRFGSIEAANKVVYAPMTRLRANPDGVPNDLNVTHYAQRADVGLIVTEGTFPVAAGRNKIGQPGLATDEQAAGWAKVADAVHAAGGKIVVQLMHAGFNTHESLSGHKVQAVSAVFHEGHTHDEKGVHIPFEQPEAMTLAEVRAAIDGYADAAERAIAAGLDGVELHGASGFLIHQFLAPNTNLREDEYGGTAEKRATFAIETVKAVVDRIGADKVGIRLSPKVNRAGVFEPNEPETVTTYRTLIEAIDPLGLAYVSIFGRDPHEETLAMIRSTATAPIIYNDFSFYDRPAEEIPVGSKQRAQQVLDEQLGHAVAVGRVVAANPHLVRKWKNDEPLNFLPVEDYYFGGARSYTDLP